MASGSAAEVIDIGGSLLSLAEAAELAKMSYASLYYFVAGGRLPVRRIGKNYVVLRSDLEAFIERRRNRSEHTRSSPISTIRRF